MLLLGLVGYGGDQTEPEEHKPVIPIIELISGAEGFALPELDGGTAQLSFTTSAEWMLTCSDTRAVPTWFDANPKSGTITTVTCSESTNLEQPDLSQQTALKTIESSNNSKLTYLYVDGCTSLETIECSRNPYLKGLDTRGCHALKTITCCNNRMESLIASGCQSLHVVQFFGNNAVLEWHNNDNRLLMSA